MMKRWLTTMAAMTAVALISAAAYACDKPCGGCKSAGEAGCAMSKPVQTASDKATGCGQAQATGCGQAQAASSDGGCAHAKQAQTASSTGTCGQAQTASAGSCGDHSKFAGQIQAVFTSLPSVKYRVGDETVGCAESAKKMAADAGKPMQFVIGDQVFDNRHDAMARLASLLEAEAEAMQTVQYSVAGECTRCPMTAKSMADKANKPMHYRVAGVDFAEKDQAEKAVQLVKDAAAAVKLSYKVGEKSFCCDKMAGVEAKKTSAPVHFVVGENEVADDAEAQVVLVNERIRTMVEAAASLSS